MGILTKIADVFDALMTHAHFASILLGLVISTGFTQLAKMPLRLYFYRKGLDPLSRVTPEIEVEFHRWTVRLVAVASGALGTFLTWPDGTLSYKLIWSLAAGLACPTLYSVVVHYVPWLADKASSDRMLDPPEPPKP